jgi:hypothetical protein
MSILNVTIQSLAYDDDAGLSNNPNRRAWDWTRNLSNIPISNPTSDKIRLAPGASATIFNGTVPSGLDGTSVLSMNLLSASTSTYQLLVTAGSYGFRTPRAISGLGGCNVTINNNALAVFTFSGATLTAVQVGDTMRINGAVLYGTPPFAFNPVNAGLWTVIGINYGTGAVSVVRPVGTAFAGVQEAPASVLASDVQFYSAAGVQVGDKVAISAVFSPVTWSTYVVADVTPNAIQFVSANPIPQESGLANMTGAVTVYSASKRFVYLEVDQVAAVQFNADVSLNNIVMPITPGDPHATGSLLKWGNAYSCTVVNQSINPLNVKWCLGE